MAERTVRRGEEVEPKADRKTKENVTTGFSAAGVRVLTSRIIAFYFRAPVKVFVRARVE